MPRRDLRGIIDDTKKHRIVVSSTPFKRRREPPHKYQCRLCGWTWTQRHTKDVARCYTCGTSLCWGCANEMVGAYEELERERLGHDADDSEVEVPADDSVIVCSVECA